MRNVLTLPPACTVSKNRRCTVRSYLIVVSPSRESSKYTTGLRAMTTSGGTPDGGTPCATRSFTCWPTLGLGVSDAQQADAARPEGALPVEARGAAPAVVANVEVGDRFVQVGGFVEAEPNLVDSRDVDHPDAVAGREVVDRLGVERIRHRHAAEAHVVGEQIEETPSRRHDPRSLAGVDGSFE